MYSRTQNENGSYNSRCLHCFMTIVSCVENETDLDGVEARHICPEKAFAELLEKERVLDARARRN